MAPALTHRPHALRISALALAALSLASTAAPAPAQTVYREYDDGGLEAWPGDEPSGAAPFRRRPSAEDEEDERFERDDRDDDSDDDDDDSDDRQGTLDLSPPRNNVGRAPQAPPSASAKPDEKAWKPAL